MRRVVFAARCANIARMAASWSSDTLSILEPDEDERDETVRRFIREARERLDWIEAELDRYPAKIGEGG